MVNADLLGTYRGKRVFVTGDTGFKGSWLALWLHDLGAEVMGYALPPEDGGLFHLMDQEQRVRQVYDDIRDLSKLQRAMQEFQPEFVFHLAAQGLVRRSYEEPKLTFDTNVGGSVNVLEAIRATPSVRSAIYVTSDKCYRNKEWLWGYRENDELGGDDPYGASKAAAEIVLGAYVESYFRRRERFGIASVRAGNVIGGGDSSANRIVPDCMRALRSGKPIVLRRPAATRPWQHVLEPLSGYLTLAVRMYEEPKKYTGGWNFGPSGDSIHTVKDVAETIVSFWGDGKIEVRVEEGAPHEAGLLHLSCDKVTHLLGWKPNWEFRRGIREVVRWYKHIDGGGRAVDVSRAQIAEYTGMAGGSEENAGASIGARSTA
jgi:CDP-glucose 4,6-dehydratase